MRSKATFEKTLNTTISIGFVMLIIALLVLCVVTPSNKRSETENRDLQSLPELSLSKLLDGSYMKSFEAYASDNIIGRNNWVSIKNNVDVISGKKDNGSVYFGKEGYLFPIEEIYEDQFEKNLSYTKTFIAKVKKQKPELNVSVLIAPTSSEILKEKLPRYAETYNQQYLISKARDTFGTMLLDVSKNLKEHDGEYIYYKTDHHWTSLGAYYAYVAWAEDYGTTALSAESFEVETISSDFYGTTYSKAVGTSSKPDTMEKFSNTIIEHSIMKMKTRGGEEKNSDIFDEEYLKKRDKYSYFLSGNNPLSTIETPVRNGKSLLVIKDSYANSFVPFMTAHFEKIFVVDLRYYKENIVELIGKNQISDVMILYNIVQYANDRNLIYLSVGNEDVMI